MSNIGSKRLLRKLQQINLEDGKIRWEKTYFLDSNSENVSELDREIWALEAQSLGIGKPYLLKVQHVNSKEVTLIMSNEPGIMISQVQECLATDQDTVYRTIGVNLRRLHNLPFEKVREAYRVPSQTKRIVNAVYTLRKLFPEYTKILDKTLQVCNLYKPNNSLSFIHGDITGENVLVDLENNYKITFLDWEFSGIGSCLIDIARMEAGFLGLDTAPLYKKEANRNSFYKGYGIPISQLTSNDEFRICFIALNFNILLFFLSQDSNYNPIKHFEIHQKILNEMKFK